MRIINFVLGKANPFRANGVNQVVHNLATRISEKNTNVEVWGLTKDVTAETPPRQYILKLFKIDKYFLRIEKDLKNEILKLSEKDWVHFHGALIPVFSRISSLLVKKNIRYTITAHGNLQPLKLKSFKKQIVLRTFESILYKNASKVHVFSQYESEYLSSFFKFLNPKDFCIIPNGVPGIQGPIKDIQHNPSIVFCGRLNYLEKGVDLLVQSFINYINSGGSLNLVLIGDGNVKKECEEIVSKSNLNHRIKFLGALYDEEKNSALSKAKFYIQPSKSEGMAISVIEAAAFGIPLIATEQTGCADYIRMYNAGFIIKPEISSIYNTLQHIDHLKDEEINKLSMNALTMIKNDLNWDKISDNYLKKLYD